MSSSKNARILIIEDDHTLNNQLADLLKDRGFVTSQRYDGQEGLVEAVQNKFDLILLDVLLPTMDGFTVLNTLRKSCQTPVMMLTACGAEEERIQGFSKGADDYLPKPFNFTELILRIEALLRRSLGFVRQAPQSIVMAIGNLRLNRQEQAVTYDGQSLELTPIQFKLLWVLANHQGDVLTKPYLYQLVLEREFSRYDRSLDMHLSRVRRKLIDAGMAADQLSTIHGKGYRFA